MVEQGKERGRDGMRLAERNEEWGKTVKRLRGVTRKGDVRNGMKR